MKGDYPNFLRDLNYSRDLLASQVPYPLVLFLPDYAISRLTQYGKNFWTWKSGLFHFRTTHPSSPTQPTIPLALGLRDAYRSLSDYE